MYRPLFAALTALLVVLPARGADFARGDYHFSTGDEPAFVHRAEVPAAWPASMPGADDGRWRYWLYDIQVDHRGGKLRTFSDHVYEARSASLLGDAGRFEIDFRPEYQTLTIHRVEVRRDGVWTSRLKPDRISLARREGEFEQDVSNGAVSALVVLDDVRVGDVVRIAYTIDGANPILAGQDIDGYHAGYHNPMLDARWRALYDPGTRLAVRASDPKARPTIANRTDAVEASFARSGVAAIVDHGDYPVWHDPFPWVQVGREQGWRDVVAWALPLYPQVNAPLPDDLEKRLATWRALPTPLARLTAALRAVQDEVRYFGIEMGDGTHRPQSPGDTWTRRFGDCKDKAYLLVTLLGRMGIEAVPALVSAGNGKAVMDFVPSGADFDHVIVRARLDGRDVWLDGTIAQQGGDPRRVDLSALGAALPLAPGTAALQPVTRPSDADDGIDATEHFDARDPAHAATLEVETVYRGASADSARHSLSGERTEDISRRYVEYYGKRYTGIDAASPPTLEDDRDRNVLRVREHYRLAAPFKADGDQRTIELFADPLDAPLKLPDSMSHPGPLAVGMPGVFRYRAEVDTPSAWSPHFSRDAVHRASPAFQLDRVAEVEAGRATVSYELHVAQPSVGPADVAKHLAELKQARDDLYASLHFEVPSHLDPRDREVRLKALLRDAMKTEGAK